MVEIPHIIAFKSQLALVLCPLLRPRETCLVIIEHFLKLAVQFQYLHDAVTLPHFINSCECVGSLAVVSGL